MPSFALLNQNTTVIKMSSIWWVYLEQAGHFLKDKETLQTYTHILD